MGGSTRRLVLIWLATTAAVAIAALVAYQAIVSVPELAGRTHPETVLEDPRRLFDDPGMLGTAVEIRVTRAIEACMAAQGFDYRGPAAVQGLDDTIDPSEHGYGIATGPTGGGVVLGAGGAGRSERDAYETALYGTNLDGGGTGGCAAVGLAELNASMALIDTLPYSIEQFEADALAHPAMVSGLGEWSRCMADKGYRAQSPTDLMIDIAERLAEATPEEAEALAEEERRTATDDFDCRRRHLDEAAERVAEELAPTFVEANRPQIEELMPPPPPEVVGPGGVTIPTDLGGGDIQVTLLWSAPVDLDLRVRGADGIPVDYNNRTSSSGGQLDRDANGACNNIGPQPVENVFWPNDSAPHGTYTITVTLWGACGHDDPIEYTVVVQIDGRVRIQETYVFDTTLNLEFDY